MAVYSKNTIEQFVRGIARQEGLADNHPLTYLVADYLFGSLRHGHRCRIEATDESQLPSQKLKKKFRAAQERKKQTQSLRRTFHDTVYLLEPDAGLIQETYKLMQWAYLALQGVEKQDYKNVMVAARRRIFSYKNLTEMMVAIDQGIPFLTKEDIQTAKQKRFIFNDEKDGHVELETFLPQGHMLVRIKTAQGMKIAAEKAANCLYSNIYPTSRFPHKRRVTQPHRFAYYQVRTTADNSAIATICLDFERLQYRYEGNNREPLAVQHGFLIKAWEQYFSQKYPQFNKKRPYGTRPRFRV